jgi:hypothetical protein
VLAQLDRIPGVAESRSDWEGRHVLIRLAPGASPEDVVARATQVLGKGARRLDAAAEAERLVSYRRGDPWVTSDETIRMSRREAGVLGARHARAAAERAGLDESQRKKLEALLTEEIGAFFERMHASGTAPENVNKEDLRPVEKRVRARCLEFANAAQVDAIIEAVKSGMGLCDDDGK